MHGIDEPRLWHGNTLSNIEVYGDLFRGAPPFFDYVLMNPLFGGKEGKEAQTQFDYKTGATQVLFLQHVLKSLSSVSGEELLKLEEEWKSTLRDSRAATAKAETIENAVYDLKAVNPNKSQNDDRRTPAELLALIAEKRREADAALARLQARLVDSPVETASH